MAGGPDVTPGTSHRIVVHGLSVLSSEAGTGVRWVIPSKQVTITGTGPEVLSIMRTLAPATRRAVPATGKVTGTEFLDALSRVPVSGPITVRPLTSKRSSQVAAIGGEFWFTGAPGRYLLTGHDGNTSCRTVTVTLASGLDTAAPPIVCQGE